MGPERRFALLMIFCIAGIVLVQASGMLPEAARYVSPGMAEPRAARTAEAADAGTGANTAPKLIASPAPAIARPSLPSFVPKAHNLSMIGDEAEAPAAGADAQPAPRSGASLPAVSVPITIEPIPPRLPPSDTKTAKVTPGAADDKTAPPPVVVPAKQLFGAAKVPSPLASRAIGSYARGCLSGGVALPIDGPAWQAMRLSRNRNWGHPKLIALVERFAKDAQKKDGWPGLLVGDISQPRGGPMLTGHASHQLGLDADVWLTPMPDRRLSKKERENISATSMLDKTDLAVDPKVFTEKHVKLIKRAASYPQVERIFVHPAIKKALCEAAGTDRGWLGKVRPIGGHYYHFHIRMACPPGYGGCKPQTPPTGEDGCTTEVDQWLARLAPPKTPPPPLPAGHKPKPRPPKPQIVLNDLPQECTAVLESGPDGVAVPPEAIVPTKATTKTARTGK